MYRREEKVAENCKNQVSSKDENEREEKWLSLLNHIINVHVHDGFKHFQKCTHEGLDREWLKPGAVLVNLHTASTYKTSFLPFTKLRFCKLWFLTRFCSIQEAKRNFNSTQTNHSNSEVIRLPPNIVIGSKTCPG